MLMLITILVELLFVSGFIIFCYRSKPRFGLAPLYVFLGSNQYIQTILITSVPINLFGGLSVPISSTLLFSAGLFAILLVYIKEGVKTTQRLIIAMVLVNLSFMVLTFLTNLQGTLNHGPHSDYIHLSYRYFFVGTVVLMFDCIIMVILYEFFFSKITWLNLYTRLLLTMLIVLNFDAVAYVLGTQWGYPDLNKQILSQTFGKSMVSVFFSSLLFFYLRYFDVDKTNPSMVEEKGKEDIFSILTYKGRYEKLKLDKSTSDEKFQKDIKAKTEELEKSIQRFTILSSVRELRIDKYSSSDQAKEFLIKVQQAFEADVCTIHLIKEDQLKMFSYVGIQESERQDILSVTAPYLHEIITKRICLAIENTRTDTVYNTSESYKTSNFQYISCAGAPLIAGDKVIGVLKLYARHTERVFKPLELEHLQLIASQLAHALENAKLFEENEKHKEVLVKQIIVRKKAEAEIRKSEEKFRNLIDQASDGIIVFQFDGVLLNCNQAICKLSGYTKEELLSLQLSDLVFGDDLKKFPFQFDLLKSGQTVISERKLKRKDGTAVELEVNTRMMPDGTLMVVGRDLTERKKAERELAESENRLRTILDTEPECVKLLNRKGELLDMNPAGLAMIEADNLDMVKGEPMINLIQEQYRPAFATITKEVFNGKPGKLEFEVTGLKGTSRWLETHAVPMKDAEGKIISLLGVTRDITDKKKIEKEIKIANERYELIAQATNDAIWDWNLQGKGAWGNESFYQLYGLDKKTDNLDNLEFYSRTHPDDVERLKSSLATAFEQKSNSITEEYRFRMPEGSYKTFYDRAFIHYDENGKPIRLIGAMQDITERKNAELELIKSEERFRSLIEQASDSIIAADTKGNIIECNSSFHELLGYAKDEIIGRNIITLMEQDQLISDPLGFDLLYEGKNIIRERNLVHKNGTLVIVEVNIKMIPDGRILSIFRDIRERKKAERERQSLLLRNQQTINSMLDGFVLGDTQGRIIEVNPSFCKMTGYSKEELTNLEANKIAATFTQKDIEEKISEASKQQSIQFETSLRRKDNSVVDVEVSLSIMMFDENTLVTAFVRDITERKKYERALVESEANAKILFDYSSIVIWDEDFTDVKNYFNKLSAAGVTDFRTYFVNNQTEVEFVISLIKVVQVNQKSVEFFGTGTRENLDTRIPAWFRKDSWPAFTEELIALAEGETHFESEIPVYSPHDGKQYHLLFSLSVPPQYSHSLEKVLVSFIDITDRRRAAIEIAGMNKQLQELSRHLQKIREEERAALSRDLHDELGQLLTAIKMDLSWISTHAGSNKSLTSKIDETLALTKNAVSTVRRINSDLRPSLLDDLGLFAAMEFQMEEFRKRLGIQCEFKIIMEEPKLESQKAIAIFRVFQESLTNIARHAHAKNVSSIVRQVNGTMELIISDDGVGFSEEDVHSKKSFGLLGMKERAMMMNGVLKVNSSPGKGTTLHLSVPA